MSIIVFVTKDVWSRIRFYRKHLQPVCFVLIGMFGESLLIHVMVKNFKIDMGCILC